MTFECLLHRVRDLVWSPLLLTLIGAVAIYLTVVLRGVQFRYLGYSLALAFSRNRASASAPGDITHFQALMTSLAAAIGTGNIAGVATAMTLGGVGAIFWMWVMALLGMALKYSEALLAVKYRQLNSRGEMAGGPMQYMANGAGWRRCGLLFAVLGIFATIGTGNMVQVHSVADAMASLQLIENPWYCGAALAVLTSLVLFGGIKSIGRVTEVFVPFMALLYLGGGLITIFAHLSEVPAVISMIVISAFKGQAAIGGFVGASLPLALQAGIARGIFSNEAGLGISSIAVAAAKTDHPGRSALVAMTSVFLSTLVVCTVTGLVIGLSQTFGQTNPATGRLLDGAPLAMAAFGTHLPGGEYVVTVSLCLFAFSTILGWAYYGEKCVEYLAGVRMVRYYRVFYVLCMLPAAALELTAVWTFADITNGLMVLLNLLALLGLRGVIKRETEDYSRIVLAEAQDQQRLANSCIISQ